MKKLLFVLLIVFLGSVFVFSQAAGSTMYVAVKSTNLKSSTGIFASTRGELTLGDAVTMIRTNGNWAEVRTTNSLTGWVNLTALSSKRVAGSGMSSSAGEIALAGKGFSPEFEIEYKKTGLDYSSVDAMEAINISENELLMFVEEGRLSKGK